jgi:hypothetical protein
MLSIGECGVIPVEAQLIVTVDGDKLLRAHWFSPMASMNWSGRKSRSNRLLDRHGLVLCN